MYGSINPELRTKPITSHEDARAFCQYLHDNELGYHFDDDAQECIGALIPEAWVNDIIRRVDEMFKIVSDPYALMLDVYNL